MHGLTQDMLRSSRNVAFPDQPPSSETFIDELDALAEMLDSLTEFQIIGSITHNPKVWAKCLRAKAEQLKQILEGNQEVTRYRKPAELQGPNEGQDQRNQSCTD